MIGNLVRVLAGILLLGAGAAPLAWGQVSNETRHLCSQIDTAGPDAAIAACTAVIQANVDTPDNLALAYYDRGNGHNYKREYALAAADYTKAIGLKPDYEQAYCNRGQVNDEMGNIDQALADLNTAIGLDKGDPIAYYDRGNLYYGQQKFDASLADYSEALRLKPDYENVFTNRGNVYTLLGKYELAMQDYTKAVGLSADRNAYYDRGTLQSLLGQYQPALQDFEQADKLQPNTASTHWQWCLTLYDLGEELDAMDHCSKAYALNPNGADEMYDSSVSYLTMGVEFTPKLEAPHYDLGVIYDYKGHYDEAIAAFTAAIQIAPDDALAFYQRGRAQEGKSAKDAALADYSTAIQLQPGLVAALLHSGVIYLNKGNNALALKDFNTAITAKPNNADAIYDRAQTYDNLGEYSQAIADYSMAIQLSPANFLYFRGRCFDRAIAGNAVLALGDCNQSLTAYQDERTQAVRGLVYLKLARYDLALLDYNAAIGTRNENKLSVDAEWLYGRGLAKLNNGDAAGAQADMAAAKQQDSTIAERFQRWGLGAAK